MITRMVKRAVFGAVGTWAWRHGKQWWDDREGTKPARKPSGRSR